MEISNKTLAMFLVAAIVVSIAGTIISLNKLGQLGAPITGYATSGTGNVSLNVQSSLSITTADDNNIDFGACTPQSGTDTVITSEANGGGTANICSAFVADEILVRNDGNVDANVTINASDCGQASGTGCTFLPSSSGTSWIAYKITNASSASYSGGCIGTYQSSYTNITNTTKNWLPACDKLQADATYNSFEFDVQINVPYDAQPGADYVLFTFQAQQA